MEALEKTGSRMPLRLKEAVLYIPHTFNPCGDVTMSARLGSRDPVVPPRLSDLGGSRPKHARALHG